MNMLSLYIIVVITLFLFPKDVSSISLSSTFQFIGIDESDFSSSPISFAGDFNKDGFSDFLIGAYQASPYGKFGAGETYLIFGVSTNSMVQQLNLSFLNGFNGIQIDGINNFDYSGFSLSSAGDFNNDGFDDILIGAYGSNSNSGSTYLIYGTTNIQHPFNLSTLNGTNGVQFNGINTGDQSGYSVSSAGDVNNDGFSDFIIGAPQASPNSITQSGSTYLIYGTSALLPHPFNLSSLNGTNGVQINGIDVDDLSSSSISFAGDFNKDGFSDFLIGAFRADPNGQFWSGETYLIFGTSTFPHPFNLSSLNGTNGIQFNGIDSSDFSGSSASSAGDFNNDGFDDILIGAYGANSNENANSGSTYLIYGTTNIQHPFNLSILNGTNGVQFNGINTGDQSGYSVSSAGDVNNDGFSDFIIGAYRSSPDEKLFAGTTYLIYGKSTITHPFNLSSLYWTNGMQFEGIHTADKSGESISSVGDFNNDGFPDFIISSSGSDVNGVLDCGMTSLLLGYEPGYSINITSLDVSPCPVGSSSPYSLLAESLCTVCSPGTYSDSIAQIQCKKCSPGTFEDDYGSVSCNRCPLGYFGDVESATSLDSGCTLCGAGTYSNTPGLTQCLDCPSPQSICANQGMEYPLPAPGYQNIPGSVTEFFHCYPQEACPGGKLFVCSEGYSDPEYFCTHCDSGANYHRINNRCVPCFNSVPWLLVVYYILIVLGIIILSNTSLSRPLRFSFIFLALTCIQSIFLVSYVKTPSSPTLWVSFMNIFSSLSLLTFESLSCQPHSFVVKFYLTLLVPLFASMIFLIIFSVIVFLFKWKPNYTFLKQFLGFCNGNDFRHYNFDTPLFLIAYFFYPVTSKAALSVFSCRKYNHLFVLDFDVSIQCFSSEWWTVAWFSIVVTVFYSIGFPLYIYWKSKTQSLEIIYQLPFQTKYAHWESIRLLRTGFTILFLISFPDSPNLSIIMIILLDFAFLISHNLIQPYNNSGTMFSFQNVELVSITFKLFLFAFTLFLSSLPILATILAFLVILFSFIFYFISFVSGEHNRKEKDDIHL